MSVTIHKTVVINSKVRLIVVLCDYYGLNEFKSGCLFCHDKAKNKI